MSGKPAEGAEGTMNVAQKTALVEHLYERILGTLFLMFTDKLQVVINFCTLYKKRDLGIKKFR